MATLAALWGYRQRAVRTVALAAVLMAALYAGLIPSLNQRRSIVTSRATGLGAVSSSYLPPMASSSWDRQNDPGTAGGVVGGVPGGIPSKTLGSVREPDDNRKVVRTGALSLIVLHPTQAVEQITQIAQQHGGYVVQSQISGQREYETGAATIRVPAAQFDAIRQQLKGLAKSVEQETTSADDVTMHYVENEATLRNYRAEEASYIQIMKRSGKIKDTLEVAEQLSDVRRRIERLEAEIRIMKLQTEMTALSVSLRTEPVVVTGNGWRPLYQLRLAWNDGLNALADFATAMMAFLLRLPAIVAWAIIFLTGLKLAWWLLRRVASFFGLWKTSPTTA